MLNCFDITWCEAPKGYEGEQICSALTRADVADYVFSNDLDCLPFRATKLIRRVKIKKKKAAFSLKAR